MTDFSNRKQISDMLQECMEIRRLLQAQGLWVDDGLRARCKDACNEFLRSTEDVVMTIRPQSCPAIRIVLELRAAEGSKSGATVTMD
jgi:hypothetical protein